ncbi:glycosyltransferase [Candidatus Sumerlaeota bacterium]
MSSERLSDAVAEANSARPLLSVIVNFHNMRREAERTLYSLSPRYQQGISREDYEVLAIDNGSSQPLDAEFVASFSDNCSYYFEDTESPSPCRAINAAARRARGEYLVVMIDGARMLSPGILSLMKLAQRMYPRCFAYTSIMHLGHRRQGANLKKGYNQRAEDKMLANIDWQGDGYRLFEVSSLGGSAVHGLLGRNDESGCFMIKRSDYLDLGGYCEEFVSPGGGLVNLDLFKLIQQREEIQPIVLLGEATFHQFHGGVITNVPRAASPWESFAQEYEQIRGKPFCPVARAPLYVGTIGEQCRRFLPAPRPPLWARAYRASGRPCLPLLRRIKSIMR